MSSGKPPVLVWMFILYTLLGKLWKAREDNVWMTIKSVNYVVRRNLFEVTGSDAPEQPRASHLFQSDLHLGYLRCAIFRHAVYRLLTLKSYITES